MIVAATAVAYIVLGVGAALGLSVALGVLDNLLVRRRESKERS